MVARGAGKIINIASQVAAIVREAPHAPYYASKSGVLNLTRALAAEWGGAGVHVDAIAPGVFYPTSISRPTLGAQPARLEAAAKRTMLGRVGDAAEDLKGAVVFLASAASDYVTAHILYVDGGWTAW
jgi:NAD(P)-dependent dehydrogenase (short-subunit alcohol dehydrogenase family)